MAALALALWVSNGIEYRSVGAATASEAELMLLLWALSALVALSFSVIIGAIIDGKRGALWGLLGPVGWIIAAIGRLETRNAPKFYSKTERDSGRRGDLESANDSASYDIQKWLILKEVDPEIKEASNRVSAIDPKLDTGLADKYLRLLNKEYLEPLVSKLISDATNENDRDEKASYGVEPGTYETSGQFKFRVLPDHSITVFSDPSGTLPDYEWFEGLDEFFNAYRSRGARPDVLRKLD